MGKMVNKTVVRGSYTETSVTAESLTNVCTCLDFLKKIVGKLNRPILSQPFSCQ